MNWSQNIDWWQYLTYISLILTFVDLFGRKILSSQYFQSLMSQKKVIAKKKEKHSEDDKSENFQEFVDLALHIVNYATDIMYLNNGLYKTWVLTLIPMISILAPLLPLIIHVISVVQLIIEGEFSSILMEVYIGLKMQIVFLLNIQHLVIEVESKDDKTASKEA